MPPLSSWMLRVAFGYLLLGFLLGIALLGSKAGLFPGRWWRLHPLHIECLRVGWLFHLVLGVAYWIFPRFPHRARKRERRVRIAFALLNVGIGLYIFGTWDGSLGPMRAGRGLELVALCLMASHLWPRIKPFSEPKGGHT